MNKENNTNEDKLLSDEDLSELKKVVDETFPKENYSPTSEKRLAAIDELLNDKADPSKEYIEKLDIIESADSASLDTDPELESSSEFPEWLDTFHEKTAKLNSKSTATENNVDDVDTFFKSRNVKAIFSEVTDNFGNREIEFELPSNDGHEPELRLKDTASTEFAADHHTDLFQNEMGNPSVIEQENSSKPELNLTANPENISAIQKTLTGESGEIKKSREVVTTGKKPDRSKQKKPKIISSLETSEFPMAYEKVEKISKKQRSYVLPLIGFIFFVTLALFLFYIFIWL